MVKQEIYKNLSKIPNLQDLVENKCYNQADICDLLKLEGQIERKEMYIHILRNIILTLNIINILIDVHELYTDILNLFPNGGIVNYYVKLFYID